MRIALINSPSLTVQPVSRSMAGGLGFDGGAHILLPPLDLALMAATLRNAGCAVALIDADPLGLDAGTVYDRLAGESWDMLIASVSLPSLESDVDFLGGLVARHPGSRVVAKTLIRDHEVLTALLQKSGAAFVIHGEADLTILEIAAGRSRAGTAWLEPAEPGEPARLGFDAGEPVADLDRLPFPARDLLPNYRYVYPLLGSPVTTVQTSRGCPYPCGFYCPYPLVEGTKWRHQSPARIFAELRQIVEELDITRIYFRDATFTLNQDRIVALCDLIIAAGWKIEWTCETRVDCLGDALLERMRAAGCVGILIGVESGDEAVMHHREGKKGLTVPRLAHLREKAAGLDIKLHFLLIVGLPRETRQSIVDTHDLIQCYRPDSIGVTIITPYPGTPLHAQARREGWIDSLDWGQYGGHGVVMHTPNLSREDLVHGKHLLDEGFAILQHRLIGGHSPPLEAMAVAHRQKLLRWAYELDAPIAALQAAVRPVGVARPPVMGAAAEAAPLTTADGDLTISVVIPTYNRRAILRKTLLAFASQTISPERFELIVVDDGSSDDTVDMLRRLRATIPLEILTLPHGGANAARNAGVRAARGDVVLLTGDDMIPGPALIETHLRFHARHRPACDAMLGFIDWSPELTVTPFMRYIVSPEGGQQFSFFKLGSEPASHHFFYTSNVSLKRSLLMVQPVLFDGDFTYPAYDDTELGYRLSQQGMTLHYVPQAVTYHHHEMTLAGFADRQRMAGRMAVVFARKHPELSSELGVSEVGYLDAAAHEQFLARAIGVARELEKPDLATFEGLSMNGEDAARFYQRIFLQPCYAEVLKTAYYLGVHEGLSERREAARHAAAARADIPGGFTYDVSIVVPVYNRVELTRQCLTRLAEMADGPSWEVIIVDNASSDGTGDFLAQLSGDVRIIRNVENLGFAKACNQGARAASGRHLLFLNNDTIPQAGWLAPLLEELDTHHEVSIVGSKLLYEDGTVQHAGVAFSRIYFGPYHIYRGAPADALVVNQRREIQCVTAACMAIRRDVFEAVGGFDEGYQNGFEDVDLCLKVRERGGRIVYQPQSVLYHFESRTPGRHAHETENGRRLFARWHHQWWLPDEDAIYVADHYAYRVDERVHPPRAHLEKLQDPTLRRRWQLVAEAQTVAQRRDTAALGALLARVDEWPADASVLRWAAELCHRTENGQHASGFWRRLAEMDAAVEARRALARAAIDRGELDQAVLHVDALLAAAPGDGQGWILQGHIALRRERFAEATRAFQTAKHCGGDADAVRAGLAVTSRHMNGGEAAHP